MILCFDIGGSRIKAALHAGGALAPLGEVATPTADYPAFLQALAGFARGRDLRGVAVSIAGIVDPDNGLATVANIPCATGQTLAADIGQAMRLPVVVLNDADCFALAEARKGAGRGHRVVFGVILGTGVGGGLVVRGEVVQGAGGFAGEWGHGPVVRGAHALACGCGQVGCLDAVGGARGLERLHRALHDLPAAAVADSRAILSGWHRGDRQALATVAEWRSLIAGPLALVVNTVGASVLPAGGGLANDARLLAFLDEALRGMILRRTGGPLLVPAICGPDAGLIGAAEAGEALFA